MNAFIFPDLGVSHDFIDVVIGLILAAYVTPILGPFLVFFVATKLHFD